MLDGFPLGLNHELFLNHRLPLVKFHGETPRCQPTAWPMYMAFALTLCPPIRHDGLHQLSKAPSW